MSAGAVPGSREALPARLAAAMRRRWRAQRLQFQELAPAQRLTTIVLCLMVLSGVVLRIWNLGALPRLAFDEHHFVPAARAYLVGGVDENDHPPLGKLFIAVGMLLFGDNAIGWRAASLILGLQTLVVAAALTRELFADRRAAWFAAAFFAGDGFFVAYSRTALLDGGLTCLVLWTMLAAVAARSWRGVLASAIGVGLAASIKWSGGFVILPAALAILMLGRAPRWTVWLFAVAPLVHVGLWIVGLAICGRPPNLWATLALMKGLVEHHIAVGKVPNPLASPWYTWLVLYHPIVVKLSGQGARLRYSTSAGNPLLYLSTTLAILWALGTGISDAVRTGVRLWWLRLLSQPETRAVTLLTAGWLALLAPWMFGRSVGTYIYHYLPSYGFALALIAGLGARLERRWPRLTAGYVVAAFALMLFFAPVWAEIPIPESVANRRLPFPTWRP
jgi:dolichyl-phosphate-mannose-protein mannosyltransferase